MAKRLHLDVGDLRNRARNLVVHRVLGHDPRLVPWALLGVADTGVPCVCNICGWRGMSYEGKAWCESQRCPGCGSVARDRFVYHCWASRRPYRADEVVLETSPRLGDTYRAAMARRVDYRSSDYDGRYHKSALVIDLQAIDLPDESLDTVITAHVLEHVPDYPKALAEIRRVLRPGGRLVLQVPLLQGRTAPPAGPEFHEDDTPVFHRFGWDLTDDCRAAGFDTTVLVTAELHRQAGDADRSWADIDPVADFDARSIAEGIRPEDLTAAADDEAIIRLGLQPPFMYVVWECVKPG